jgi:GTPase SAR1 family protein
VLPGTSSRERVGNVRGTRLTYHAGKSSLTVQFVDGHFVDSYYPTIENTFSKMIRYNNQEFATEIIDTAGQVL